MLACLQGRQHCGEELGILEHPPSPGMIKTPIKNHRQKKALYMPSYQPATWRIPQVMHSSLFAENPK